MTREEAIEVFNKPAKHIGLYNGELTYSAELVRAFEMAIEALEFMGKYDAVWEGIKCAGEHGKEVELHRYGRVYRIREVAT